MYFTRYVASINIDGNPMQQMHHHRESCHFQLVFCDTLLMHDFAEIYLLHSDVPRYMYEPTVQCTKEDMSTTTHGSIY